MIEQQTGEDVVNASVWKWLTRVEDEFSIFANEPHLVLVRTKLVNKQLLRYICTPEMLSWAFEYTYVLGCQCKRCCEPVRQVWTTRSSCRHRRRLCKKQTVQWLNLASLNEPHCIFGQLIDFREIVTIVAIRGQILGPVHQILFRLGLLLIPRWEALLPNTSSWI